MAKKFIQAVLLSTPVLALTTLPASSAHAMYLFADPTGFDETPARTTYNLLGTDDLSLTVVSQGDGITFDTETLNFETAGTSNPSWMGGLRDMFKISFDGVTVGGPRELAQLEFTFSAPLSTQSYLLLTDFDSYESLAIAAFDSSSTLIPFGAFTFLRHDGQNPSGDTLSRPTWSNSNPTQSPPWTAADNNPWVGTDTITGLLEDETAESESNSPAVSLQSTTEIKRIVFYYNAKPTGVAPNSIRFNFASPDSDPGPSSVPGPLSVLGAGAAFGSSRKLRHRIKKAERMKARG